MKIAMVSEHANPLAALGGVDAGGQNVHVAELSSALTRRRHQVTVYTRRDDPHLPERVRTGHGYDVVHVPAGPARPIPKDDLLPYMGEFADYLRHRWGVAPPDLVHSHFWMSGLAAVLATADLGLPVVHTYHALGTVKRRHQGAEDTSPHERVAVERMVGRSAAAISATCSDEVFELVRMGVQRSGVTVVPCGVDPERFQATGPHAPRGRGKRIVSVGRLVPRKGFDTLISALRSVPDAELVIAGGTGADRLADDPEALRLEEHARRADVADRVRLIGRVSRADMPALLRSADVVACVPWYEPFGIVPLEAMACGVPVVASAVGGLTDTVVDGVTGTLVPPRDAAALGRALRGLLSNASLRDVHGTAGRERVEARYTWDRIAFDTERVYLRAAATMPAEAAAGGSS